MTGAANHHKRRHSNRPGARTVLLHGNQLVAPSVLREGLKQANMTVDGLRDRPDSEDSTVRYTVLLLAGWEPDVYVACVPVLDVVAQ